MESAKKHITAIVENYIRLYPADFQTVKEGIRMQRGLMLDEFGSAKLSGSSTTRALFEIPVVLSEMLIMGLDEEEMRWFKDGIPSNRAQGARWFAKTFRAFALPENI